MSPERTLNIVISLLVIVLLVLVILFLTGQIDLNL